MGHIIGTIKQRADVPSVEGAAAGQLVVAETAPTLTAGYVAAGARGSRNYGTNADTAESLVAYQCHGSNVGPMGTLRKGNGNATGGVPFIANTITTREGARQDPSVETYVIQEPLSGLSGQRGIGIGQGPMFTLNANNPHGIAVIPFDETQITHAENRSRCAPGDPSPTLAKTARPPAIAFHMIQDPITEEEASPALGRKSSGMGINTGAQVRRLTPLECERLMGDPDEYTNIPGAKDGPRYAALGNSIAVPCLTWIFRRIAFVDRLVRAR